MKRIFAICLIFTAVLTTASCTKALEEDIAGLKTELSELETRVAQFNNTLTSLSSLISALEKNDHIKSISPWAGGDSYAISFTSGNYVFLYQGKTGVTPIVGVQYNESLANYYWTIQMGPDGKVSWMTASNGTRVRATGVVPQMKIEDGIWMYSFDGKTWTRCSWGEAEGTAGSAVFESIDTSDPYYVVFTLANGTVFKIPTQKGYDELTKMCETINNQFDTYTKMVNDLDGSMFVKQVSEWQENGETVGYILTMEDGSILQIRNGRNYNFTTQISARQDTDGKYYWIYRTDASQAYQWLIYKGEKVPVTPEDVTPMIGITEIDGILYFTICYQGGVPELMRDADGKPVQATGRAGFSFFQSAEVSDGSISLTMADGSVVTLPTRRLFTPSLELSQTATNVAKDTYYDSYLMATVIDTLQMMAKMPDYATYKSQTGTDITSVAVDGGYTGAPILASYSIKNTPKGEEYTIVVKIPFRTGSDPWDTTRKTRIAVFLNWGSNSIMKVATFSNI